MKKATHTGTCQVCGREQALPGGMLAKHGYTVDDGYFRGTCPGSTYAPLEQHRGLADTVAADLMTHSRIKAGDAKAVADGTLLPVRAKNGQRVKNELRPWMHDDVYVPFAQAPAHYQAQAVTQLQFALESDARHAAHVSEQIVLRAGKIYGKRSLKPVAPEAARKAVAPGVQVRVYGNVRTVLRVEDRRVQGIGPHLNGQTVPHAIYLNDQGRECCYPTRLIRQAAIL